MNKYPTYYNETMKLLLDQYASWFDVEIATRLKSYAEFVGVSEESCYEFLKSRFHDYDKFLVSLAGKERTEVSHNIADYVFVFVTQFCCGGKAIKDIEGNTDFVRRHLRTFAEINFFHTGKKI